MAPVALLKNIALTDTDTGGQTSTVGEPSAACSGDEIFVTGNWYATKSLDGGSSWRFVNPYTLLPSPGSDFCCDQSVSYDPSRNLFLWLLQYVQDSKGTNVLRLAVKKGGTLADDSWHWWDFSPKATDAAWSAEWFDYPDVELSDNFLYLTTNSFEGEEWRRSVVFRCSLDELAAGGELTYRHWSTTENFSLRCVSGASETMHFASHNSVSQVRVFSWPEADDAPSFRDVDVSAWSAGPYVAGGPTARTGCSGAILELRGHGLRTERSGSPGLRTAADRVRIRTFVSSTSARRWSIATSGARTTPTHIRARRRTSRVRSASRSFAVGTRSTPSTWSASGTARRRSGTCR